MTLSPKQASQLILFIFVSCIASLLKTMAYLHVQEYGSFVWLLRLPRDIRVVQSVQQHLPNVITDMVYTERFTKLPNNNTYALHLSSCLMLELCVPGMDYVSPQISNLYLDYVRYSSRGYSSRGTPAGSMTQVYQYTKQQ